MIERGEDDAFARPPLTGKKRRAPELRAGDAITRWPQGHRRCVFA
jgi:hypothetical protein